MNFTVTIQSETRARWRHPAVVQVLLRSACAALTGAISTTAFGINLHVNQPYSKATLFADNIAERILDTSDKENSLGVFNIRLFTHENNLVLQLSNRRQTVFYPAEAFRGQNHNNTTTNTTQHVHPSLGTITSKASERTWQLPNNLSIDFTGSFPIALHLENYPSVNLHYKFVNQNHRLESIAIADQSTTISHPGKMGSISKHRVKADYSAPAIAALHALLNSLEAAVCTDGTPASAAKPSPLLTASQDTENNADQTSCQNPSSPLPVGFEEVPPPGVIRIEARPADCHSYFTAYPSIQRGTAIEQALADYPPYLGSQTGGNSFPIIDFWNNGAVNVVISRDLTATAYDAEARPNALFDQVIRDGENIHENFLTPLEEEGSVSHTELGVTSTVYPEDAQVVYLDIVVQFGVMTTAQQQQIKRAKDELLDRFGIVVRIVEIP